MIFLTTAANDRGLLPLFGGLATLASIPHGDFAWFGVWGTGEATESIKVCGDRKKLGDLISCIDSGRHIKQVQQAREAGFLFQFLVVEGVWRRGETGLVEVPRGNGKWYPYQPEITWRRVRAYLDEMDWYCGVRVRESRSARGTVELVVGLYHLFQKIAEDHQSLKAIYSAPAPTMSFLTPPSLTRRIAKELPGVGWTKAKVVEEAFSSPHAMVNAGVEEWMAVDGIGKVLSRRIVDALNGGE